MQLKKKTLHLCSMRSDLGLHLLVRGVAVQLDVTLRELESDN
jgi:hypothetical protein